jgi:hypothetical protein
MRSGKNKVLRHAFFACTMMTHLVLMCRHSLSSKGQTKNGTRSVQFKGLAFRPGTVISWCSLILAADERRLAGDAANYWDMPAGYLQAIAGWAVSDQPECERGVAKGFRRSGVVWARMTAEASIRPFPVDMTLLYGMEWDGV